MTKGCHLHIVVATDLIHWIHAIVRVDPSFHRLVEIDCALRIKTIYDTRKKRR